MLSRSETGWRRFRRPALSIAFQPIVSATPGGVIVYAYEALARAANGECPPQLTESRPSRLAYAMNFMSQRLALATACEIGLQANLSLNVTPGAVCHPLYGMHAVMHFAREIGFPADRIIFEITELEPIRDYRMIRRLVDEYRKDGVRLALDDFGTGFNGLNTLLELRPDIIKIDMALIRKIETDMDRQSLLFGICSGGDRLGMRLIAEGVETLDTVEILSRENVDLMQGFLFARPQTGVLPEIDSTTKEQVMQTLARLSNPANAGDMRGAQFV